MRPRRSFVACVLAMFLAAPAVAGAREPGTSPGASLLRPEWQIERTKAGAPHIVGYLYNSHIKDAANVLLRVERLTPEGLVGETYGARVVGDVLSGDRLLFDVPVPEATATYRVVVERVDWIKECR